MTRNYTSCSRTKETQGRTKKTVRHYELCTMPPRDQTHYFGAGPAPLPTAVLEEATRVLLNYKDLGYGIAEMSHRSSQANEVLADAKSALAALLDIPESYEILFLQGGGSGEFSAVVYHMVSVWVERQRVALESGLSGKSDAEKVEALREVVRRNLKLDYLVTGSWSLKASQEAARLVGAEYVNVALDARKANGGKFGMIPEESSWTLSKAESAGSEIAQPALTYFCDNETVDGVEFQSFPATLTAADQDRLVVADMSSNFLSRKVDVPKYSVIFGGAQKNIGVAGVTIVIIKKSLLGVTASPDLLRKLGLSVGPVVLDFTTIAKNNSLYNTLPIFDVWIAGQVMSSLVKKFGNKKISGQQEISDRKAKLLYDTLDASPEIYQVVPDKSIRSRMNICLRIKKGDADAEKAFLAGAEKNLLFGLKGHRSVGGIRISNCELCAASKVVQELRLANLFSRQCGNHRGS